MKIYAHYKNVYTAIEAKRKKMIKTAKSELLFVSRLIFLHNLCRLVGNGSQLCRRVKNSYLLLWNLGAVCTTKSKWRHIPRECTKGRLLNQHESLPSLESHDGTLLFYFWIWLLKACNINWERFNSKVQIYLLALCKSQFWPRRMCSNDPSWDPCNAGTFHLNNLLQTLVNTYNSLLFIYLKTQHRFSEDLPEARNKPCPSNSDWHVTGNTSIICL